MVSRFASATSLNVLYRLTLMEADAETNVVTMRTMNGLIAMRTTFEADVTESGMVLVDTTIFAPAIGTMPKGNVRVKESKKGDRIHLSGVKTRRSAKLADAGAYPATPTFGDDVTVEMALSDLLGWFGLVNFAASVTRDFPILRGVLLTKGRMYTSDGTRVAQVKASDQITQNVVMTPGAAGAINSMAKLAEGDTVTITYGELGWVQIGIPPSTAWIATLGGTYPSLVETVIADLEAKTPVATVLVNRANLEGSLSLAQVYASAARVSNEIWAVYFSVVDGKFIVHMETTAGALKDTIKCEVEGDDVEGMFDPEQIRQGISVAPDDLVRIRFYGAVDPIIVDAPQSGIEWYVLMMPVVIRDYSDDHAMEASEGVTEELPTEATDAVVPFSEKPSPEGPYEPYLDDAGWDNPPEEPEDVAEEF